MLEDLLTPAEVQATIGRIKELQKRLKKMQSENKLLTPDQWDQYQSADLKGSYAEEMEYHSKKKDID